MSRSKHYKKINGLTGIWQNRNTKSYFAEKRIKGKYHCQSFSNLHDAKKWRKHFDGTKTLEDIECERLGFSTLKHVWEVMQEQHFPSLATSTKQIWKRRFKLWEPYQHLKMNKFTPSKVTTIIYNWVEKFSSDDYQSRRGQACRCNMNNELNMFVTIFNWYKESEEFEKEAHPLTCPIKKKHRDQGFIKPVPVKKKQIDPESAFIFFECLPCLYQDLAIAQFLIAGRVGETCGIQWSNIDLENRRLIIKETCIWDQSSKTFVKLKAFPKNKEPRPVYITDELKTVFERRAIFRKKGCNFVFHVEGRPLNYGTIQLNYREAQRKSGIPYTGTHILRYGLARIERKLGGIEGVMAITGHKEYKMADHYSRSYEEDNEKITKEVMDFLRAKKPALMSSVKQDDSKPTGSKEINSEELIKALSTKNSPEIEEALLTIAEQIKANREMPDTSSSVGKADVISLLNYKNGINRH